MSTVINLKDIKVESLSGETLELISLLTAEILKITGNSFSFDDPRLLPKIRRRVKRLKDPALTALYHRYQEELLRSVNNGQFELRNYPLTDRQRRGFQDGKTVIV
ncbi:MAG: hypothetical protein HKN85_08975 [Gammaproteobacteria bacterium]|nr:hypothetical protein [Gammaproteobacteria bacterium]